MAVKQYKKSTLIQAIQFQSTDEAHIQDIIDFVGLPISIDYTSDGVRLRVIRGTFDVIVVYLGNYIVLHSDGKLESVEGDDFDYEEVQQ